MPLLDVSDVLDDDDFRDDSLQRVRQTQTVGTNGMAVNTQVTTGFSAVVTQNSGNTRAIGPDGQRISGDISIFSRTELIVGDDTRDADIVIWGGRRYVVVKVAPYDTYGDGYTCAFADLLPLRG